MRSLALAITLACATVATAQEPTGDATEQAALLVRAEALEDACDPAAAIDAWSRVESADFGSRMAARARERRSWLSARSEGGFAPLSAWMRFTSLPRRARDPAVVRAFQEAIAGMPDGRVRIESRLAVAGEWARLGETDRALEAWEALLTEPTLEDSERTLVHESMARARMDAGDAGGALEELEDSDLGHTGLHEIAARAQRATALVPLAWSIDVVFALSFLVAVLRSRAAGHVLRAAFTPLRIAVAAWIGLVPWLIARSWADESHMAFALLGASNALVVLSSFALGEAIASPRGRAIALVLASVTPIANAYLAVIYVGEALPFA